ncbi:signal transduction histidine kinase [Pseudofulvimonas gallinarii]|uniref:histidine kinase n=3 Tax=Pseudofulvimonas gallinarii TaxID=634155 RepID=A0A4V2UVB9_9GAMM|nr:signal transduction histidine kinase [Pseudofulvimonas gallinarii]
MLAAPHDPAVVMPRSTRSSFAKTCLRASLAGMLLVASLVNAGPGTRWVERQYGPADGLPVSSASAARIDADGFLWVATHDGLARFDGELFDVHDSMRFPAMSGNRVLTLHDDGDGRLYALTAHGDWLRVRSGQIDRVNLGAPLPVIHVDPPSLCVTTPAAVHCPDGSGAFPVRVQFPDGVLATKALPGHADDTWLLTVGGEIWRHRNGRWESAWSRPSGVAPLHSRPALVASDGSFWTSIEGPLLRISMAGEATVWDDVDAPHQVLQLREDASGRVWIGNPGALFRSEGGRPVKVFAVGGEGENGYHLSWQAPDGALWVRAGPRLWRFEDGDGPFDPRLPPVLHVQGLTQDLLFADDGAVWVMTLRGGLYRLVRARVELLDAGSPLGGGNVYGVTRDSAGTMWMGTLGDGIKGVDDRGNVQRLGSEEGLPGVNPWLVAAAPDGTLYAGTYAPGLWQRPPGAIRFEPVPLPDELFGEQVLALHFDDFDAMWLGSTAGAWRRDRQGWQRQWPLEGERRRVNALAMSGDAVWFGGAGGVWRRHGDGTHAVAPTLLANTSVRDLYVGRDGALWISTDGRGLIRVAADDPRGYRAIRLGRAQGLPSNSPHAVREDHEGHLWVNSNQGIFRLARGNLADLVDGRTRHLSPLVLGLSDGLTELEGNGGVQPSAAFDAQGRLWFPSQRGVVRFDPRAMSIRTRTPKAVIDTLESQGEPLSLPAGDPSLPVGVRSLTVRYAAADLHAGAALRFRYRLWPLQQGWTDALGSRTATFAGLGPGQYRFEVLAGNSDGIWASDPTVLEFEVPPRWYEMSTVRGAGLALLLLVAAGAVRLRGHRLRQRAVELDRQVHERTAELLTEKGRVESALAELSRAHAQLAQTHEQIEDSNLRLAAQAQRLEALDQFRTRLLADVSHELRTPVMLVSMPLEELSRNGRGLTAGQRDALAMSMRQLDRLGGLVEQLVGLVQVESGQMPLRASRFDIVAFLQELARGYRPVAEQAGATVVVRSTATACEVLADRQHLTTIFGNLVDNALKHAPHGSSVDVDVSSDDDHVFVEVADYGPGFDGEAAQRLFERFFRVAGPPRQGREGLGIGLALARELIELHGGRISAKSTPGEGATFRVELPLGSAHVALDELALDATSPAAAPRPGMPDRGDGRVLLVEDHPDLAAYLADRLGEHLPVTSVGSAEAALAALEADPGIRLVVSDIVLPGQSGIELCRQLTSGPSPVPVILISAKAGRDARQAGMEAGARAYLAKPFAFDALLADIAAAWPAVARRLGSAPTDPSGADPLLAIALSRLEDPAFAVSEWAARAFLGERQLRRRVNELTGQSPQTWLREQRLLRVRHLLARGECRTLAEAGARAGLDNPSYLYRSYRARFGDQ